MNLSTKIYLLTMGAGNIPWENKNLVSLTALNLGPNLLTGSISASIGMLKNMQLLDLDENKLSGDPIHPQ